MPELPEIETIKNFLERYIIGYKIIDFIQFRNSLRYEFSPDLKEKTKNAYIINIRRIAKYLVMDLSNEYSVIFHLGMTGRVVIEEINYSPKKHDHIIFIFQNMRKLVFNDSRRFGMLYICKTNELSTQKFLRNIGLEPFSQQFNEKYLEKCFKNKKIPIKPAIMDNKIVVGVGNIYASEALFHSQISPLKLVYELSSLERNKLIQAINFILTEAIKAGGTTLRDFVNGDNKPGYFKQALNVYGRNKLDCYICKTSIIKLKQSGRATYFCPICQK